MAVINTNIASLNAQNNLMKSQNDMQTSLQRLSSGLRINSAKDDAAGLQISNRLTSQINGLNVAVRNANDGISLSQTAEGAMQETTNILQRMRELSLQSANGSYGSEERKALNDEVVQLKNELDRIATTTRFGSKDIFSGGFSENIQIGDKANETISVKIDSFRTTEMGTRGSRDATAAALTATNAVGSLTISSTAAPAISGTADIDVSGLTIPADSGFDISVGGSTVNIASGSTLADVAQAINDASISGYSASYDGTNFNITNTAGDVASTDLSSIGLSNSITSSNYDNATADGSVTTTGTFNTSGGGGSITIDGQTYNYLQNDTIDTITSGISSLLTGASSTFTITDDGSQWTITNTAGNVTSTDVTLGGTGLSFTDSTNFDNTTSDGIAAVTTTGFSTAAATTDVTVGGQTVAIANGSDGAAIAQAINDAGVTGYSATYDSATTTLSLANSAGDIASTDFSNLGGSNAITSSNYVAAGSNTSFQLSIDGGTASTIALDEGTYTTLEALADNINQKIAGDSNLVGQVRATIDQGKLQFVTTDKGSDASVTVTEVTGNSGLSNLGFSTGDTTAGVAEGAQSDQSVEKIDITTIDGAQSAIATIDAALKEVDTTRASLGAIQNRFESTISNLTNVSENASAARSRIQDADFAQETANLTRAQILQQAGTSILAQANQLPQSVLSLLQ